MNTHGLFEQATQHGSTRGHQGNLSQHIALLSWRHPGCRACCDVTAIFGRPQRQMAIAPGTLHHCKNYREENPKKARTLPEILPSAPCLLSGQIQTPRLCRVSAVPRHPALHCFSQTCAVISPFLLLLFSHAHA